MSQKSIEQKIHDEVIADFAVINDNAGSGSLVERHVNGISFGLWGFVALFVLGACLVIWEYNRETWPHLKTATPTESAPASAQPHP